MVFQYTYKEFRSLNINSDRESITGNRCPWDSTLFGLFRGIGIVVSAARSFLSVSDCGLQEEIFVLSITFAPATSAEPMFQCEENRLNDQVRW